VTSPTRADLSRPRQSTSGLLVRPEFALVQQEVEPPPLAIPPTEPVTPGGAGEPRPGEPTPEPEPRRPKRFHGSVVLDPQRVGRDAGRIEARKSFVIGAKV